MTSVLVDLLVESRRRGFLGPGPVEIHLDHARAFVVPVPTAPAVALDLGAGGGLPGLILAVEVWPATRWIFLDAQRKRTDFLLEAVEALGLADRVDVVCDRAEAFARQEDRRSTVDLVVARSFGPPAVVAECAAPLLRAGGQLVVSEPPGGTEARWPATGLALVGMGPATSVVVPADDPVHLAAITQDEPCPERYPRRVGIPTKRPLF